MSRLSLGGVLIALQALAGYKRSVAMEDASNAQAAEAAKLMPARFELAELGKYELGDHL